MIAKSLYEQHCGVDAACESIGNSTIARKADMRWAVRAPGESNLDETFAPT